MKRDTPLFSFCRITAIALGVLLSTGVRAHAQSDPLPSWNDGPAKQSILSFVNQVTDKSGPNVTVHALGAFFRMN